MDKAMVKALAQNFNGITMAYMVACVNALLGLLIAFGVPLTDVQDAAIIGFVNAALVVSAHLGHRLGEVSPTPTANPSIAQQPQPPDAPMAITAP